MVVTQRVIERFAMEEIYDSIVTKVNNYHYLTVDEVRETLSLSGVKMVVEVDESTYEIGFEDNIEEISLCGKASEDKARLRYAGVNVPSSEKLLRGLNNRLRIKGV